MHHAYADVFQNTPAMQIKLTVGNRNRRDAQNELIRKRPKIHPHLYSYCQHIFALIFFH